MAGESEKVCLQKWGQALLLLGSSERLVGPWRGLHLGLPLGLLPFTRQIDASPTLAATDPMQDGIWQRRALIRPGNRDLIL